jgi:transposase
MMILELHRRGLSISAIAGRTGRDRKTVRRYIQQELTAPKYKPRQARPTTIAAFEAYLRQRVAAWPEPSSVRLLREVREHGYQSGMTVLYDFLRTVRPPPAPVFEVRFETSAGYKAQVDFAEIVRRIQDRHCVHGPGQHFAVSYLSNWTLFVGLGQDDLKCARPARASTVRTAPANRVS